MKIGIDARLFSETGVGRYIRNLVKELQDLDTKNEYVLFVRKADYEKCKSQMENGKWKIVIADIRWHTVDEQLKLPQILNKENLDLVHFPYFSVPVGYHKPFVMTIHDLIINHFPTGQASKLPLYLYQLKRLGYNYIVKNAVSRSRKIIVPLNAVRDDLVATLGVKKEKIIVTYEGFDEKIISNNKRP
ncbi:MAG TPA: glycosyltransferase, partial [Xanthomonadales bacterium]|nr:glycosyltransferase [Xanthomonadales bacterium]